MNKPNIDKWIYGIRKTMNENGLDESELTDEDCLEILMGFMVPALPKDSRKVFDMVGNGIWGKMYFKSLLSITKPTGELFEGIDIELLRAKLNTN